MSSIKITPFIHTTGDEKYKDFINQAFNVESLSSKFTTGLIFFSGWYGKDLGEWKSVRNDDGVVLEFYPSYYTIKLPKETTKYTIPLPETIDMFITDMFRYNIQLYWNDWIDTYFEPKQYLPQNEIKDYFVNLLKIMDKSHELL